MQTIKLKTCERLVTEGFSPFHTGDEGSIYISNTGIIDMDEWTCVVCGEKKKDGFELIKHHISYYPERIAHVHFHCHAWIHDELTNKNKIWILYESEDPKKFYKEKNNT